MAKIEFGDTEENVITRKEFPVSRALDTLAGKTIAVIGYGVQGPAQALNLKDNGFSVIVGQRPNSASWEQAKKDGWVEGTDLFTVEEATKRGSIVLNLLSDAGQIDQWPAMKAQLTPGKTLCFSHGFGMTYHDKTNMKAPEGVDVVLVAPKGSGKSVRRLFTEGRGINSSIAVHQDATGAAKDTAIALGIGVGSGYLFETTFEREVTSDLVGERGVLMGALAGMIEAQYTELRKRGHSPSEAFNETVEELTQSLVPLVGENGMDWMFSNCSSTAQRGALDWKNKFRDAVAPVFTSLYDSVANGSEAERTITCNSKPGYRDDLNKELAEIREQELWRAGASVRRLRP